jgi:NADH dehydrogenase
MSATDAEHGPKSESRPRVLILGGGFAGIGTARKLRKSDVDVVLVDGHDYHTFQPLLYQVATDLISPLTVGHPLRDLFDDQPNARIHTTDVSSVDLDKRGQVRWMAPL